MSPCVIICFAFFFRTGVPRIKNIFFSHSPTYVFYFFYSISLTTYSRYPPFSYLQLIPNSHPTPPYPLIERQNSRPGSPPERLFHWRFLNSSVSPFSTCVQTQRSSCKITSPDRSSFFDPTPDYETSSFVPILDIRTLNIHLFSIYLGTPVSHNENPSLTTLVDTILPPRITLFSSKHQGSLLTLS